MDLDTVRLFVRAARTLNITAAGRQLGLSPAVASARLAKLERTLGADLFHRTTRKVTLSLEGAEFLPFAEELLAQENAALAALGRGAQTLSGKIRLSAPSTFAQLYLIDPLNAFCALHPQLTLDLHFSDKVFDFIDGSFDLALRNMALPDSSLKARRLASDTRILCASPDYLRQHGTPLSVQDLDQHTLIAFGQRRRVPLVSDVQEAAELDLTGSNCRLLFDDGQCQRLATLAGAGISQNALWAVHTDLEEGRLVRVLPDYTLDTDTALWLVYPQSNILSPKVRALIDYLRQQLRSLPT